MKQGKVDNFVRRVTTRDNLAREKPKSRAKKYLSPLESGKNKDDVIVAGINRDTVGLPGLARESTRVYEGRKRQCRGGSRDRKRK